MNASQTEWILLSLTVDADHSEIAVGMLWELEPTGIQEFVSGRKIRLEAYFPAQGTPQSLTARVAESARRMSLSLDHVTASPFHSCDDDWIVNWKKNFHGFAIGDQFYVYPPWEAPNSDYPVCLKIEPSQAFGTGTHESTQLCLLLLRDEVAGRRRMLDVGTGSGILAAAAVMLNPAIDVFAFDDDPDTAPVARSLLADNGAEGVCLFTGQIEAVQGAFDLVTANLTLNIFRALADDLCRLTKDRLILSGFTSDQRAGVLALFSPFGLKAVAEKEMAGWVGLTMACGQGSAEVLAGE